MKIQIASDLHMEHWRRDLPDPVDQFAPDEARDLLILAGDITDGKTDYGLAFIRRELDTSPVIYVPGNHEYYYASKQKVDNWWRAFATYHQGFHYLNDETVEIGGLRFYGAEWCSDFWGDEQHYYFEAPGYGLPLDQGLEHDPACGGVPARNREHEEAGGRGGRGDHPFPADP